MANYTFPARSEHPDYYLGYLEYVKDEKEILNSLRLQGEEVLNLYQGLPDEKLDYAYAEGKWTIKEVLRHIIDTERILAYRALRFARGETIALPSYDHDEYVVTALSSKISKHDLLEEYRTNRAATIAMFTAFDQDVRTNIGIASDNKMSVRALPFIIAGHELHHVNILKERYL